MPDDYATDHVIGSDTEPNVALGCAVPATHDVQSHVLQAHPTASAGMDIGHAARATGEGSDSWASAPPPSASHPDGRPGRGSVGTAVVPSSPGDSEADASCQCESPSGRAAQSPTAAAVPPHLDITAAAFKAAEESILPDPAPKSFPGPWTAHSFGAEGDEGKEQGGREHTGMSTSGRYDLHKDVVLRIEFMSAWETRVVVLGLWAAVLGATAVLVGFLWYKLNRSDAEVFTDDALPLFNLITAIFLFLISAAATVHCTVRAVAAARSGKRWSPRRARMAGLAGAQVMLQLVNCLFFIVPNAYVLTGSYCRRLGRVVLWSGFVQWTCWNTLFLIFVIAAHNGNLLPKRWARYVPYASTRKDCIVVDAPLWLHWRKLALWAPLQGVVLALSIVANAYDMEGRVFGTGTGEEDICERDSIDEATLEGCALPPTLLALSGVAVALMVAYDLLFLVYIRRGFVAMRQASWATHKMGNVVVRLELRTRVLAFVFFVATATTYFFVEFNTCRSFLMSWLGFTPSMIVMTAVGVAQAFMWSPKMPGSKHPKMLEWLQMHCWTEAEMPHRKAQRASYAIDSGGLEQEPMFCYETAVKMFLWSGVMYNVGERDRTTYSFDDAMALYGLEQHELLWERSREDGEGDLLDTKCLIAWSSSTVVIAFRGTASLGNVLADVQVWQSVYPPHAPANKMRRPRVHSGFSKAWRRNGISTRVAALVYDIVYNKMVDVGAVKVYVTGHSLGGALAQLCAFDIARTCPCLGCMAIRCYTFGAPRLGNHEFAREFNSVVKDAWSVINDQDIIARSGKTISLLLGQVYKRPGHRVLINRAGDMLVRPGYLEVSMQRLPGGASVKHHFLVSYQQSLVAICTAQLQGRGFSDGPEALLSLTSTASLPQPGRSGTAGSEASARHAALQLDTAAAGGGGTGGEGRDASVEGGRERSAAAAAAAEGQAAAEAEAGGEAGAARDRRTVMKQLLQESAVYLNAELLLLQLHAAAARAWAALSGSRRRGEAADVERGADGPGGGALHPSAPSADVVGNFSEAFGCDPNDPNAVCRLIVTRKPQPSPSTLRSRSTRR